MKIPFVRKTRELIRLRGPVQPGKPRTIWQSL
jgi:hypothetical protein